MIRIGKLTDYAFILLGQMARARSEVHAAAELSARSGIALPTVSKVLKMLARAGVARSVRGSHGGYTLADLPDRLSVARIIDAMEGPIALTDCAIAESHCQQAASCGVRGHWAVINQALRTALDAVTLADLLLPAPERREEILIPLSALTLPAAGRAKETE
jgi:FeS assembly SUF system regulator